MTARRYARVRYPWRAAIDTRSSAAVSLYATLIDQGLRYGMPAQRFGRAGAVIARVGVPRGSIAAVARFAPRRPVPAVDRVVDEIEAGWPTIAERLPGLPPDPPELCALALRRSASLTIFVLDVSGALFCVGKLPVDDRTSIDREVEALERAEGVGVAPLFIGTFGGASVQEALPGAPMGLDPLTPQGVARLGWSPGHERVSASLTRLAASSVRPVATDELDPWIERAGSHPTLSTKARTAISAAARDISSLGRSVLQHGDTSVQNCLMRDGELMGFVDWEYAMARGVPGFDLLNFAVAYVEHSLGLRRWSEGVAVEAFTGSWDSAPFMAGVRRGVCAAATAAEIPERFHDALEVAFFGRRLGRRVTFPDRFGTGPDTAARMLERVCG